MRVDEGNRQELPARDPGRSEPVDDIVGADIEEVIAV
jgi:hypothetical protein